jgi:hypothetical protein
MTESEYATKESCSPLHILTQEEWGSVKKPGGPQAAIYAWRESSSRKKIHTSLCYHLSNSLLQPQGQENPQPPMRVEVTEASKHHRWKWLSMN